MKNIRSNQTLEIILLMLLAFLWGSSFTLIKVAVETVPPATIVAGRLLLGALVLQGLMRQQKIAFPTNPSLWGAFFVQGLLQSALPFLLISWGEQYIDSGMAGLLNATPPLFAILISYFILKQGKVGWEKFLGVGLGFGGVLIMLGSDVFNGTRDGMLGQAAVTGSSVCYAIAALYARRFSNLPPLQTAACSMTMAAVMILPVSIVVDQPWKIVPSFEAIGSIVALGILSTALAMVLYFRLVKTLGAVGVTSGSYPRAGFSIMLGVVFLNEQLTLNLIAGMVFILVSVAIVTGQIRVSVFKSPPK